MAFLTGGHVQYTRRVKTGDYEHKDIVVLLNWSAAEGDGSAEGFAARVADMARSECERLVNGKAVEPAPEVAKPKVGRPPKIAQVDTAPVVEDLGESKPAAVAAPVVVVADDLGEDITTALAPDITDKQLTDEITHVNGRISNAPAIRALIGTFVGGPPKGVRDIPQAQRADFVAKLKALK